MKQSLLEFYQIPFPARMGLDYILSDPQANKVNVSAKGAYVTYLGGSGVLYPWNRLAEIAKDLA